MLDRQLKIQQVCQVSRESMRWTKKQVESKPAIGQLGSQSDRQGELAVKKPCRQTGEWGDRWAQRQQQNTPKMHQSSRHIDKHTSVDVGNKAGRPVLPGRRAPPLMLWHSGVVSHYGVPLIHRWGGALTLTSMQPKPMQPVLGSLVQLCQGASKDASAARLQRCVCLTAWYSNICLILL